MLSVSSDFKREILKDNRNYIVLVEMTLADGTELTLDNDNLWDGGVRFEESTSSEESFDIGSAVIGECTLVINNIYRTYDAYDFYNAEFSVKIGLMIDGEPEMIRRGFYTVDEATYNGSLITLVGMDNMWKFDVPFSDVTVNFPTTAQAVVRALCQHCGVVLLNSQFDKYLTVIPQPINKTDNMNCREILSYVAQICCLYCKMTPEGSLKLDWYNKSLEESVQRALDGGIFDNDSPYSTGDDADGGSFSPWDTGYVADGGTFEEWYRVAYLTSNSSMDVATDDTLITGVQVKDDDKENGYDYTYGTDDYCIVIENNPFIIPSNAQAIVTQIGAKIVGLKFRTFDSSSLNDVSLEAGDVCVVKDFRGDTYYSFITNLAFEQWNYERFSCGAESNPKNKTRRYSERVSQAIKQAREDTVEQISSYDLIVQRMNKLASNSMGLFFFEYKSPTGGSIMYQSNRPINEQASTGKPSFTIGSKVWKLTGDGFFVCTNASSNDEDCTWVAGWDSDNNVVVNTLSAIGINFDWAHGGTLTLGGDGNVNGSLRVLNANGTQIAKMDKDGFESKATTDAIADLSSRITQTAGEITTEVSRASTAEGALSTRITQNSNAIVLKVSKGDISSEISAESGQVHISSNRFVLDSTNCSISADGTITAKNCTLSGTLKIGNANNLIEIGNSTISMGSSYSTITIGTGVTITSSAITIGASWSSSALTISSSGLTLGSSSSTITIGGSYGVRVTSSSINIGRDSGAVTITSNGITLGGSNGVSISSSEVSLGGRNGVVVTSSQVTIGRDSYGNGIEISGSSITIGSYYNAITINSSGVKIKNIVQIGDSGITIGSGLYSTTSIQETSASFAGTLKHMGSKLGFFGHSESSQQSVSTVSSSADLSTVISKLNELINALDKYGLV